MVVTFLSFLIFLPFFAKGQNTECAAKLSAQKDAFILYESQPIVWHFKFQTGVNVNEFREALACQYNIHAKRLVGVYNSSNEAILQLYGSEKDIYYFGPPASSFHSTLVSEYAKKMGIFNQTFPVADFKFVLPTKGGTIVFWLT
jgi:hypothetical protein